VHTLENLARQLSQGTVTSRDLVERCLSRIADSDGEGARAFIHVNADGARLQADAIDKLRAAGAELSPLAGIPVSVKDLFDVRGQVTRAGSAVLCDAAPAEQDATVVQRLRRAGMVIIGRTNMTEFAYSGLGLNPHYGTPLNPFDRTTGRIPGGSSSGAAISVSDGMAAAAIGTDTGGSCRIPAAFCGITGFKPTARRVPRRGVLPLSGSLDSVGPLAASVSCCALLDAVLSGEDIKPLKPRPARTLRIGVLVNYVMDGVDRAVSSAYQAALTALSGAGARLEDIKLPELDCLPELNSKGGLIAAEAYAWHRDLLRDRADSYDPRVSVRIMKGADQSAADYIDLVSARHEIIDQAARSTCLFDAIVYPTTPLIAPTLAQLDDDDEYGRINLLALRNPTVTNFLDRCGISIPIAPPGDAPVGLMLMGHSGRDDELLSVACKVETAMAARS